MSRKILFFSLAMVLIVCCAVVVSSKSTYAQIQQSPEVYVAEVSVSGALFQAGTNITGTFTLLNGRDQNVSDVYYKILLVGDYQKNGLAAVVYDSTTLTGPVFLVGSEQKDVPFTYAIPQNIAGTGLGIQVQTFLKNGLLMGWQDSKGITVTGSGIFLTVTKGFVVANGQPFDVQSGPTIYKDQTVSLSFTLKNSITKDISVIPKISIYKRSGAGELLNQFSATTTIVEAKSTKTIVTDLPLFNYKPGVYVGEIVFKDSAENIVAPGFEFRYIIGGPIVTIVSVSSSQQSAHIGDSVSLAVLYSSTPYDIVTGSSTPVGNAVVTTTLFNEYDENVGTNVQTIDFNATDPSAKIVVPIKSEAGALRTEISVTQGTVVLATYSAILSSDYAQKQAQPKPQTTASKNIILFVCLLILVVVIIILLLAKKFRKNKIPTLLFVIMVLFLGWSHSAMAFTETYRWSTPGAGWGHGMAPNVFINSPSDNVVMTPGQTFDITGSVSMDNCTNGAQVVSFSVGFDDADGNVTYHNESNQGTPYGGGHGVYVSSYQMSFGQHTAPTKPGIYHIYFNITNTVTNKYGTASGETKGYQTFTVVAPPETSPTTSTTTETPTSPILSCNENWVCDPSWGICSTTGQKTRNCTDLNNCGTTTSKPTISQPCTVGTGSCNPRVKDTSGNDYIATFANINQLVTWTANGTGPYLWSGDGVINSSTGSTYQVRYPTIGNKTVFLEVDGVVVPCIVGTTGNSTILPIINNPNFHEF